MILNYEQIKSLTVGAAKVSVVDGKYRFARFNDVELDYYKGTAYQAKSESASNIHFDFVTDATAVRIDANMLLGSSRTYFAIDVLVNGRFVDCIKNYDPAQMQGAYTEKKYSEMSLSGTVEIGEGEKRVTVVLPWSSTPQINEVELVDATYFTPVKRSKKMLIYGDSITQGYDALNPSNTYAFKLAMSLDADAQNKAIGGEVFRPELAAIKADFEPDYISVAYGTNDWSKIPRDRIVENTSKFYHILAENYPNAKIFAITPIWRKDYRREDRYPFEKIAEIIEKSIADIPNAVLINGFDFVPQNENLYADLRLHPNDKGFEYYADNLIKEIKKHV